MSIYTDCQVIVFSLIRLTTILIIASAAVVIHIDILLPVVVVTFAQMQMIGIRMTSTRPGVQAEAFEKGCS